MGNDIRSLQCSNCSHGEQFRISRANAH
jgi:hypothetical protein